MENHLVAVAGIEHIVVFEADAIAGDTAYVVHSGRCRDVLDGDILAGADAAGTLALRGAERLAVVAVGDFNHTFSMVIGNGVGVSGAYRDAGGREEAVDKNSFFILI